MKTVEKVVQQTAMVYIAEDGTEFNNERNCFEYEKKLKEEKTLTELNKILIHEDDFIPCNGKDNWCNHVYKWYKVESKEQLKLINDFYGSDVEAQDYPEYINIELYDDSDRECSGVTLTECKNYVKEFFEEGFGIKINFE